MRIFATLCALFHATTAHMRLQLPPPFGAPLQYAPPNYPHPLGKHHDIPEEVLFPCQLGPDGPYSFDKATTIAAGDSTLVQFIGEILPERGGDGHTSAAVHAGGSCQFSISKTPSHDPRDWKVIKTFIGGCPATAHGNIAAPWRQCSKPDSKEVECVKSYNIQIPKETPDGDYFFAWTWFNKLGNREMYMQCAPIKVTGGGSDPEFLDTLPSIFMANCEDYCDTAYGGVLGIPNPGLNVEVSDYENDKVSSMVFEPCQGKYVDLAKAPNFPKKGTMGGTIPSVASYLPMPAPNYQGNPAPYQPPAQQPAGSLYTGHISATSYITTYVTSAVYVTASAPAAVAPSVSSPAPTAEPKPISAAPVPVNAPATDSGARAAGKLSCTGEGTLVCVSLTQFGLCDRGCLVPQAVAAGTICDGGIIKHAAAMKRDEIDAPAEHHHNHLKHHAR
jgi:hypothetical protein